MRKGLLLSAGLVSALYSAKVAFATPPPAGTVIGNVATAVYYDENNNKYTSTSNLVQTVVKAVYGVDVQKQVAEVDGTPGQVLNIPFNIKNLGNTLDNFTLTPQSDNPNVEIQGVYIDKNGNGVVDPGENPVTEIPADLGETVPVIVVAKVKPDAPAGETANITLTAQSQGDNTKSDSDQTQVRTINDAVVQISMSVDKDVAHPGETLTYTVNFSNTGNKAAHADTVNIDGNDKTGILVFAPIPENTTFNNTVSQTPTGGTVVYSTDGNSWTTTKPTDPKYVGYFIPDDNPDDNNYNAVLDPDQQGSFVFTVDVVDNPTSNLIVDNSTIKYRLSDGTTQKTAQSNQVTTTIPAEDTAAVSISPDRTVDNVPAGAWVEFKHTVTNDGINPDTINLIADKTNLPPNAVVEFWNGAGNAKLVDTDGDGYPDVGELPAGNSTDITVKIYIPQNTDNGTYSLDVYAQSGLNPDKRAKVTDTINGVVEASVDIAKPTAAADGNAANDDITLSDNGTNNILNKVDPGESAYFPIEVVNNGGSPDAYGLVVSGIDIPGAVTKIYEDTNANGVIDTGEKVVTKTQLLGGTTLKSAANAGTNILQVYDVGSFSVGDTVIIGTDTANKEMATVTAVDTTANTITLDKNLSNDHAAGEKVSEIYYAVVKVDVPPQTNATTDNFTISAQSLNSGSSDNMTAELEVNKVYDVTVSPDNNGQIPPGGTLTYQHTVINNSNTPVTLKVEIPTDTTLSYTILDENKNPVGTLYDMGTVQPFSSKKFYVKVIAPSNVDPGTVEALPVTAKVFEGTNLMANDTATDTTTIIEGYLQLTKYALDANCQNEITEVDPGGTICYKVRYKNIGTQDALDVKITDPVPQYTSYVTGSLCLDSDCDGNCDTTYTDNAGDDQAEYDNSTKVVIFRVGSGADATAGGKVQPGEYGCVLFKVRVDQ